MSAFNWIKLHVECPSCLNKINIRCQAHVAASFGGTPSRFSGNEYLLGESMLWWPNDHPEYERWRGNNLKGHDASQSETESEACYATCPICNSKLYVVVKFHGPSLSSRPSPAKIEAIGLEKEWPSDFLK